MGLKKSLKLISTHDDRYSLFDEIDGQHPIQKKVHHACVDYPVRTREGGKVVYFNFGLAKEMGLIADDHQNRLTKRLEEKILETFSLVIVNEYDVLNQKKIDPNQLRPHKYMATRYLQLQHPSKLGNTSGDGRSIWNGYFEGIDGVNWDITSCGTGATCLSPATSKFGKYFETGDPSISYGCGYAETQDGLAQVVLSEIYHRMGINTERCLAVIEFEPGIAINVRAGRNLVRPSHLFCHLKQNNYKSLKAFVDYYIDREKTNKNWQNSDRNKYKSLLKNITKTFSHTSAIFESEYIFCWMDWDGDNILMDGGIIDYGSIRQFGLFHHEYRYDDDDRWSTNIKEQKDKAKYIVQVFAQMVDYIITGKKKPIKDFNNHKCLKEFDREFQAKKDELLLIKLGIEPKTAKKFLDKSYSDLTGFKRAYEYFEKTLSVKDKRKTADGITKDAIFCMRDILRVLPKHYLQNKERISDENFIDIIKSSYATEEDLTLSDYRRKKIHELQDFYVKILYKAANIERSSIKKFLKSVYERSNIINRSEKLTGDAVVEICSILHEKSKKIGKEELFRVVENFVHDNVHLPEYDAKKLKVKKEASKKTSNKLLRVVADYKEGI